MFSVQGTSCLLLAAFLEDSPIGQTRRFLGPGRIHASLVAIKRCDHDVKP